MATKYLRQKMMNVPFDNVISQYLADRRLENLSHNTLRIYEKVLAYFRDFVRRGEPDAIVLMSSITPQKAKEYVAHRMSLKQVWANHPHKPAEDRALEMATIHLEVRSVKTFGVWLERNGYGDPFAELKTPKLAKHLIDILTEEDIEKLFGIYNPDTHFGARWQAILAFALDTGVRLEELITLQRDRLDLQNSRAKVCGKGNKERYVRYGIKTQKTILRYQHLYRQDDSKFVFANLDGSPMTSSGMQDIVRNARKKSGIQRFHFHLLRHTFATNFLASGGDALELKDRLGHESLSMTDRYVHLARQLSATKDSLTARRPSPLDSMKVDPARVSRRARRPPAARPHAQAPG